MKPLSVEMACLLGIQNEIQAVCNGTSDLPRYSQLAVSAPNFSCIYHFELLG